MVHFIDTLEGGIWMRYSDDAPTSENMQTEGAHVRCFGKLLVAMPRLNASTTARHLCRARDTYEGAKRERDRDIYIYIYTAREGRERDEEQTPMTTNSPA